jgi:Uma2 family endonuclease
MAVPQNNKIYTYADYKGFDDNVKVEIIEGNIYMQAAPSWQHQAICFELARQFGNYLVDKSCRAFTAPFDLIIPNDNEDESSTNVVQPDLLVVCNKNGLKGTGYFGIPDLIIEICSPSTMRNDKVLKFNKYEQAGVREYWIVEPEGEFISVFTLQENMRYGRPDIYTDENKIRVGIFEDFIIDLKTVFE